MEMGILNWLAWKLVIQPKLTGLKKLLVEASIHPAGSMWVCSPPVIFTDVDFLVYPRDMDKERLDSLLVEAGYRKHDNSNYGRVVDDRVFSTWRRGSINLIVEYTSEFASAFQTATHICKRFNIKDKLVRILVHEWLRGVYDYNLNCFNPEYKELTKLLVQFKNWPHLTHAAYRVKYGLEL